MRELARGQTLIVLQKVDGNGKQGGPPGSSPGALLSVGGPGLSSPDMRGVPEGCTLPSCTRGSARI
jgi:hypothetical protein